MFNQYISLEDLVLKKFKNVTWIELKLLKAIYAGEIAFLKESNLVNSVFNILKIRAELISWICTNNETVTKVHRHGIRISSAKIVGELDLSFTVIAFPLEFFDCVFSDRIYMESTKMEKLTLKNTDVQEIWAVRSNTFGDVLLTEGFTSWKLVNFDGAFIGGNFDCGKGKFLNRNGTALSLVGSTVTGNILLWRKFQAFNEVNLRLAVISGNLDCSGGKFQNINTPPYKNSHEKYALACSQTKISGSALFRNNFEVRGTIQLTSATVGRDLDCDNAKFINGGNVVIQGDRIEIGGNVSFINSCTNGCIEFPGANIKGQVKFKELTFFDSSRNGVNLNVATIKNSLYWYKIYITDKTELNLYDAIVNQFEDDKASWPKKGNLRIAGFKYNSIKSHVSIKPTRRSNWLKLQPNLESSVASNQVESLQPYSQLAEIYNKTGYNIEARMISVKRENVRYAFRGWTSLPTCLWGGLLKYTIGYGYVASRALIWALGFVLLGWMVFYCENEKHQFRPIKDNVSNDSAFIRTGKLPKNYEPFEPFMYSLDSFLPIIDLHQESYWLPKTPSVRKYLWFHIVLGWLLTTLVVSALTGIIRKT